jgi:hypothetical protein
MASTSARIAPALARWHPVGTRGARRPSVALASTPRLTFRAGCPSFGGQRTDFCPRATPWPCAFSQPFVAHGRACAEPSARAVRPLAASEPAFAHHRHHLSTSKYRAVRRHRPRSRSCRPDSMPHFARQRPILSASPGPLPIRHRQAAPVLHRIYRSAWPASSFSSTIAASARSSNQFAVLPNPSFNLTPSGWLRQPPVAG